MSNTIELPRDYMLDDILYGPAKNIVCDRITDAGRWRINHELIFRHTDNKLYLARYSHGSTEYQDESPWENDDVVTCYEVREVPSIDYEVIP